MSDVDVEVGDVVEVDTTAWDGSIYWRELWHGFVAIVYATSNGNVSCRPFPFGLTPTGINYFQIAAKSLKVIAKCR